MPRRSLTIIWESPNTLIGASRYGSPACYRAAKSSNAILTTVDSASLLVRPLPKGTPRHTTS